MWILNMDEIEDYIGQLLNLQEFKHYSLLITRSSLLSATS